MPRPNIYYNNIAPDHFGETEAVQDLLEISDGRFHCWFGLDFLPIREIDFLLIHEDLGAFVIEIKSITIYGIEHYDRSTIKISKRPLSPSPNMNACAGALELKKFLSKHVDNTPFLIGTSFWSKITSTAWRNYEITKPLSEQAENMIFMDDLASPQKFLKKLEYIHKNPPVRNGSKKRFQFNQTSFDDIRDVLKVRDLAEANSINQSARSNVLPTEKPVSKESTLTRRGNSVNPVSVNPLFHLESVLNQLSIINKDWKTITGGMFYWSDFQREITEINNLLAPLKSATEETLHKLVERLKEELATLFDNNIVLEDLNIHLDRVVSEKFQNTKSKVEELVSKAEEHIKAIPSRIRTIDAQLKMEKLHETYKTLSSDIGLNTTLSSGFDAQIREFNELWSLFNRALVKTKVKRRKSFVLKFLDRLDVMPEQEALINLNINGHYRVQGVPGSGKTVILIHRAIRLARENPANGVYIFTVNRALAKLIEEKILSVGGDAHENIKVFAFYDFLIACIEEFEPSSKFRLVDDRSGERIKISWDDFCLHPKNVFSDSKTQDLLSYLETQIRKERSPSAKTVLRSFTDLKKHDFLNADDSNESAIGYLRDELIFIQSALSKIERHQYLDISRVGRSIPLNKERRTSTFNILEEWEEWLQAGDLCDLTGMTLNAFEVFTDQAKLHKIKAKFGLNHILVDECQDFSTIEIRLLRMLLENPNNLNSSFFVGDLNQKIYSKYTNFKKAGFSFSQRSTNLAHNHRNTKEILLAAHELIRKYPPESDDDIDLVDPELSNWPGEKPRVLSVDSQRTHVPVIMELVSLHKECRVAIITSTEELSRSLKLELEKNSVKAIDIKSNEDLDLWKEDKESFSSGHVIISKIDAIKGFEFDVVILADITDGVVPPKHLPIKELWREAANIYCAMTRAREVLYITCVNQPSIFLKDIKKTLSWDKKFNMSL